MTDCGRAGRFLEAGFSANSVYYRDNVIERAGELDGSPTRKGQTISNATGRLGQTSDFAGAFGGT
jgi:hypothetical protein